MDSQVYSDNVGLIIDNMEGGYYHPQMLKDGRVKDTRYGNSGETMFGIDRKMGGTINDTVAGKQFWSLIDNAGAKDKWKWNYMGGEYAPKLKELAAQMMKPQYDSLSNKYLSSTAKEIVDNDARLLFNFIYATWNGSGWFQKFAAKINAAVASGVNNPDELTKVAVAARTQSSNSLIAQGGNKIASLVEQLKKSVSENVEAAEESISTATTTSIATIKKSPAVLLGGVALIGFSLFLVYKFYNQHSVQTTTT